MSRVTVRKAIAELVEEGYVRTRQGSGTYVADELPLSLPNVGAVGPVLHGFLDDLYAESDWAEEIDVDLSHVPASSDVAVGLGCSPGTKVTRYLHVRGSASRPYGYGEDHLPYAIGRLLAEEELRRQPTLLHVLTSLGFRPGAMTHSLEPCNANDEVARRLDVEVGDAIIRIDGVLTSEDGTVLSVYRFFVREGRGIQVHLTRAGDPLVLAKEAKRPARDMAPMP